MNALIDADIVCYRSAAASEDGLVEVAKDRADWMINTMLDEIDAKNQALFLTGKDNFRYSIFPEYKAFRKDKQRPKWEPAVKQHLIDQWEALVIDGMEADDALGIAQCSAQRDTTIICTVDKDLNCIPGWHYNFVKKEKFYVSNEEAIRFFFNQLLVGDPTDGIKGVPGIGKVKAAKLLDSCESPEDFYEVVKDQYSCEEEMDLNAKCLYIWRKQNDNWRNLIETS